MKPRRAFEVREHRLRKDSPDPARLRMRGKQIPVPTRAGPPIHEMETGTRAGAWIATPRGCSSLSRGAPRAESAGNTPRAKGSPYVRALYLGGLPPPSFAPAPNRVMRVVYAVPHTPPREKANPPARTPE